MILSSTPWRCCSQWLALMGSMIFALWLGKQCSAIAFFSSLLYPSYPNWFKLHPKHVSINYWWSMGNFLVSKFLKPFRRVLFQRCHGSLILYIDENIKGICLISFKAKQNWNWNTSIKISVLQHSAAGYWVLSDVCAVFPLISLVSVVTWYFTGWIEHRGTSSIFWNFSCSLVLISLDLFRSSWDLWKQ